MTRDYSNRNGAKSRNKRTNQRKSSSSRQPGSGTPFFAGLFIGLVLGVILTTLIELPEKAPDNLAGKPDQHDTGQAPKPRFDFYTLLRESEVIVSADETPVLNEHLEPEEQQQSSNQPPENIYLLQVGSFKNRNDADSLRANLLLLNLDASIERVFPKPGETWHRVLVGPMENRADVTDAKAKLAANRIDSLLLKRKR